MTEESKEITVIEPATIVRAAGKPGEIVSAFQEYRFIQKELDRIMEDSVMTIAGKKFRKKSYWRAIATAFNLDVSEVKEQHFELEGDFGWAVTYKATAPNGRNITGDGACFASEKRAPNQRTVHNVRSHAHTRAFNRAVSNLVGFGEVSAEEMLEQSQHGGGGENKDNAQSSDTLTDAQKTKIWVTARETAKARGEDSEKMMRSVYETLFQGIHSTSQLSKKQASMVIEHLLEMQGGGS